MTNVFTCLRKKKFGNGNGSGMDREYIGNGSGNGSSRALGMSTSGQAYIEHTLSIYSAYIGTSRNAGGKKYGTMRNSCVWKYAACLFICMVLCVENAWGAVLYSETWETNHRIAGNNDFSADSKTYGAWTMTYADVSSNPSDIQIQGDYLAICRIAKNTKNSPQLVSSALTLSTDNITNVSWRVRGNSNISLTASYSTDGTNWTIGKSTTAFPGTNNIRSWGFDLDVTGTLYLKFVVSVPGDATGSNRDVYIDSIFVTGTHAGVTTYSLSYAANGGSGTMTDATDYSSGDNATVASNSFSTPGCGYEFSHWNTKADGSGTSFDPDDELTITQDTTLYAQWRSSYASGTVFTRISDVSDISEDDEIIFVNQAENYACGLKQNDNNRTPVAIETSNHTYIYSKSDLVQVFTVKTNESDQFGFHTGCGYIYSISKNNYLRTNSTVSSTDPSGAEAWTLSASSNVFTITNVTNTTYHIAFNGTNYFSQYTTEQIKPYIYKKVNPTIIPSVSSISDFVYSNGSPVAQSFTVSGSELVSDVTISAPSNYQVSLDNSDWSASGGSKTITASGTLSSTTVYVRLAPNMAASSSYEGDVTISATGADDETVSLSGSVPYTITWKANDFDYATTYVNVGSTLTLPAVDPTPEDYGCDGKEFYGWYGGGDSYSHATDAPTIAAEGDAVSTNKTFHAVFATSSDGGSSSETLSASEITTNFTSSAVAYADAEKSWTDGTVTWAGRFTAVAEGPYMQIKSDNAVYIKIIAPATITSVQMKATLTSCSGSGCNVDIDEHENATATISLQTAASGGTTVASGPATDKSITLNPSGNNSTLYIKANGATKIWAPITVSYSSTTYSDFNTICECSINPTVTSTASLKGTFSLSTVGITVEDLAAGGAICEWTDVGFVWSGTSSTPTLESNGSASSNCTKLQKATSGTATTFDAEISSTFSTGSTYYYRAYGKNDYTSGSYQFGTVASFTPQSVTFNSNGGSAVATTYVNNGAKVAEPSEPTKTGYNFGGWQLSSSDYDFENTTVTSNITLDAVWTAKTSTVTLDKNGATTGSSPTIIATYASAMPDTVKAVGNTPIPIPSRNGYTFTGYYDSESVQYYSYTGNPATLASAKNWDKEDATITLYAGWEAKVDLFIDDMHGTEGYTSASPHEESGANYTFPELSNEASGNDCETSHYIFVGWVVSTGQNDNGSLGSTKVWRPGEKTNATNATYYAVWAEE